MKRNNLKTFYKKVVVLVSNTVGENTLYSFGVDYMSIKSCDSVTVSVFNHSIPDDDKKCIMYETVTSLNTLSQINDVYNQFKTFVLNSIKDAKTNELDGNDIDILNETITNTSNDDEYVSDVA